MSAKRFAAVVLALHLLLLPALSGVAHADDPPAAGPVEQTPLGPITALDKELLVKVRLAGLRPGRCYVWRVWPYIGRRFTSRPLGVSNFCVTASAGGAARSPRG